MRPLRLASRLGLTSLLCCGMLVASAGRSEAGWWSDWWGGGEKEFRQRGEELYHEHQKIRDDLQQRRRANLSCNRDDFAEMVHGYAELIRKSYAGGTVSAINLNNEQDPMALEFFRLSTEAEGDLQTFLNQYLARCCPKEQASHQGAPPGERSRERPSDAGGLHGSGTDSNGSGAGSKRSDSWGGGEQGGDTIQVDPERPPTTIPDWMRSFRPHEATPTTKDATTSTSSSADAARPSRSDPHLIGDGVFGTPTPGPLPPNLPSGSFHTAAICCEKCPSTDFDRFYLPIPPDTECQPGDARRDDLTVGQEGTCANPMPIDANNLGPTTYGAGCCSKKTNQVLYDSVNTGGLTSEVGSVLRGGCGDDPCQASSLSSESSEPPSRLETSVVSTGSDAHGRNWVPEDATLTVGKQRLRPCATSKFYVTKEAVTHNAAVAVITAISHDYEEDAHRAEASEGTACPLSGGHGSPPHRETRQERMAKTAALGLLASQAKGQVTGLRATFDVTGLENQLRHAKLQSSVVNEVTQEKRQMSAPMSFEPPPHSENRENR